MLWEMCVCVRFEFWSKLSHSIWLQVTNEPINYSYKSLEAVSQSFAHRDGKIEQKNPIKISCLTFLFSPFFHRTVILFRDPRTAAVFMYRTEHMILLFFYSTHAKKLNNNKKKTFLMKLLFEIIDRAYAFEFHSDVFAAHAIPKYSTNKCTQQKY